ncbi:MAG: InlB B-repeat-containing protein [bacterium]
MPQPAPDRRSRFGLVLAAGFLFGGAVLSTAALDAAVFRVDGVTGADGASCGTEGSPCATIQQAVDLSASGDTVLVSEGTYVDDESCGGEAAVVCIFQKELTILGGFSSGNWSLPDPEANTTIIDGQDTRRGVLVRRGGSDPGLPATSLRLEGFTVRNGRAEGQTRNFGGGLKANFSDVVLRDTVFQDNVAVGGTDGQGGGGGAALLADENNTMSHTLERVVFQNNQATGGGGTAGDAAVGGGLVTDHAVVSALDLRLDGNTATGGGSASAGKDALGGGAAFMFGTTGTIRDLTATSNTATGGSATTTGGGAFGGGVFLEGKDDVPENETSLTLLDSSLSGNTATGGDGSTAGGGVGAGIDVFFAQLTLERSSLIGNLAEGGTGDSTAGNAGGGGLFLEWPSTSTPPLNVVRNSIIADNSIDGSEGGGGGIRLLAADALVSHSTFVDNRILGAGFGNGILVGPRFADATESELTLAYSILADHTVHSNAFALHVQANDTVGSTADLSDPNHFVGNDHDTNQGEPNSGTFAGFPGSNIFDPAPSDFFVDPVNSDYHVDGTNPPTDAADGSSEALDFDGAARSGTRDMGADEFGALAFALSVGKVGVGEGTVASSPAGIDCGPDCFESYEDATSVTLTATPDSGFFFTGWSGDADCDDGTVLMNQDRSCTAQFEDEPKECTVQDDDLVLTDQTVSNTVTEEACNSITAGPAYAVGASGDVIFHAPTIVLRDGFTVEGTFTAVSGIP